MHSQYLVMAMASLIATGSGSLVDQTPLVNCEPLRPEAIVCDCKGTIDNGTAYEGYICRDPRLGPYVLPRRFPLVSVVSDYDRFGGKTPGAWLHEWWNVTAWDFKYPDYDGFQVDTAKKPISGNLTLRVGTLLDRFGGEHGKYISAADAPYAQRSLPPRNLDFDPRSPDYPYNYHVYRVLKEFVAEGGPIAPYYGQPGLGAQFYIGRSGGNILTLIEKGYLGRVNKAELEVGPGTGNPCG